MKLKDTFYFSWQDMAQYDLPAVLNHVLNVTKADTIYYIGHSQGTLMANAQFSEDTELAAKIKLFISLAPIGKVTHVGGFLGFISPLVNLKVSSSPPNSNHRPSLVLQF